MHDYFIKEWKKKINNKKNYYFTIKHNEKGMSYGMELPVNLGE